MSTKKTITKDGIVTEAQMSGMFKIQMEDDTEAMASLSGKMRKAHIRVLIGDRVKVEFSPHDLSRGRIVFRYR